MNTFRFAMLALTVAAFGCTDSSKDEEQPTDEDSGLTDSGTTDVFYDGPVTIQEWDSSSCTGGTWTVWARTEGWIGEGYLYVADTRYSPSYDEEHPLPETGHDDNGYWSEMQVDLAESSTYSYGVSTLFKCSDHLGNPDLAVTNAAWVTDVDGNFADCVVWGHDTSEVINKTNSELSVPSEIGTNCYDAAAN